MSKSTKYCTPECLKFDVPITGDSEKEVVEKSQPLSEPLNNALYKD